MNKKKMMKQATAVAMCSAMAASGVLPAYAADVAPKYTYQGSEGTVFEKISHANSGTETNDGIVDYVGDGKIAPYVQGESTEGNGDRGQSYSYASVSYGDWVYVNTMYGGLGANMILKQGMDGMSPEAAGAVINTMYNGHMYTGEPDGDSAGGMLVKFNTKTGETKILMSKTTDGIMPTFRSAIKMNGKLYFVGMIMDTNNKDLTQQEIAYATAVQNGFPCIYEIDPENNDKMTCIYNCVDTAGFRKLVKDNVFTSTRAIGTYKNSMIAGCLDTNDVFLTASKDPSKGQDSFKVIANMEDLFNYPAYHRSDVNGGGGIYQVVEYNDALYVVVCTGTEDSKNDKGTLKTFAIVKGTCNGDVTDKDAWTWTVLAGDKKDGAKYPFGLDEERISAGACTLQVYDDYLYIGDYNDVSSALQGFILRKDFTTQATNLEQSINLYRMDKNEEIEKVVGDPTKAFPTSLTGLGSGYTSNDKTSKLGTHMNQYTWQTTVYDGKLYVGTMDTTTLLEPIAQFTNGDLLEMDKSEWKSQLDYIRVLLELMTKKDDSSDSSNNEKNDSKADTQSLETSEEAVATTEDEKDEKQSEKAVAELSAEEQVKVAVQDAQEKVDASSSDDTVSLSEKQKKEIVSDINQGKLGEEDIEETVTDDVDEMNETMSEVKDLIDSKNTEKLAESYDELYDQYDSVKDDLPDNMKAMYDTLINYATKENIAALLKSTKYLKTSEAGFDLFEISDNKDGSVDVEKVTTDGFGDRFNHGVRIFEKTNDYWVLGTANPFNGTQLWRTDNLEDDSVVDENPVEDKKDTPTTDDNKSDGKENATEDVNKNEQTSSKPGKDDTKKDENTDVKEDRPSTDTKPDKKPTDTKWQYSVIKQVIEKMQNIFSKWKGYFWGK